MNIHEQGTSSTPPKDVDEPDKLALKKQKDAEDLAKEAAEHGSLPTDAIDSFTRSLKHYHFLMQRCEIREIQSLAHKYLPSFPSEYGNTASLAKVKYLTHWFKNDFFKWIDRPCCELCGKETKGEMIGYGGATEEEEKNGGRRVEVYECGECDNGVGRFVRYQYGDALLKTKGGRCGEWANCFGFLLRVAGFEMRKVIDWTDHVWIEVWIDEENRWIHVDSCEDIVDEMKLYEKGWGKKLNYALAVGRLGIVDVTKGYVLCWEDTLKRRDKIAEGELRQVIEKLNEHILKGLSDEDRSLASEIGYKTSEYDETKVEELGGRTSGSKEWIAARGEQGSSANRGVPKETLEFL